MSGINYSAVQTGDQRQAENALRSAAKLALRAQTVAGPASHSQPGASENRSLAHGENYCKEGFVMTSKERFYATVNYTSPDRPLIAPLEGQSRVWERLYNYFDVPFKVEGNLDKLPIFFSGFDEKSHEIFSQKVGLDFRSVSPGYIGPELKVYDDGSWDGLFGERWKQEPFTGGFYEKTCHKPLAGFTEVDELKNYRFPSADWYDYNTVAVQCDKYSGYAIYTEGPGAMDYLNGIGFLRGVEQVYIDIALEDPVYLTIVEKRFNFFYEKVRRTLEAAKGKIDAVRCGEDLGTQLGPIINPEKFRTILGPKYRDFFKMIHSYGAKTMMHSCGSVRDFIPIFIDLGLDILEVVQVDAKGMDIEGLHRDFYKKIVFSGSMSVQNLLPKGTPEDIVREVERRKCLFRDGGIIVGPTNVMQIDMPTGNFVAMCKAIGCLI